MSPYWGPERGERENETSNRAPTCHDFILLQTVLVKQRLWKQDSVSQPCSTLCYGAPSPRTTEHVRMGWLAGIVKPAPPLSHGCLTSAPGKPRPAWRTPCALPRCCGSSGHHSLAPTTHLSFVWPWSTCQKCSAHKRDCMWQCCRAGETVWLFRALTSKAEKVRRGERFTSSVWGPQA